MTDTKKPTRRRTAKSPDPDSTIIKTNNVVTNSQNSSQTKLGAASSSVVRTQPKVYSPLYLDSSLNLPRDLRTQNAWNRNYYATNPIVRSAINLHASYTAGKFRLVCKHKKILDFFEDMLEKMNFQSTLLEMGIEYFKLGECCLPGTLVTMGDGSLKPIENITRGDIVLTHKGNLKKVSDLKTQFVKQKISKIKTRNSNRELAVTGNHPIWALKEKETKCCIPSLKLQTCWPKSCICDENKSFKNSQAKTWDYSFIKAEELSRGDFCLLPHNTEIVSPPNYINKDWARLFGYWLAEGCFAKNKYGNYSHIIISNSEKEIQEELLSLADKLGYKCYVTQVGDSTTYNYNFTSASSKATNLVEQFYLHGGEYSNAKVLSSTIMQLPLDLQKEILSTYINGDGSVDGSNGQIQLSTNSLNLRNQLNILLARSGCIGVFTDYLSKYAGLDRQYVPTDINYRITFPAHQAIIFKDSILPRKAELLRNNYKRQRYSVILNDGANIGITKKIQKIQQEYYEGWVYNLEVEDDHSYVAEGIAVHNCFPYAELNEEQGIWDFVVVHNPDFIRVAHPSPLSRDPIISLVPDENLKKVISSNDIVSRTLREQLPFELLAHLQKGEDIPLDNFNVSHMKMLSSPYDTRGISLITSCYRDLLLYDKIREAKITQADNFINPLTLVKLGNENWKPTDDDIRQWQEQVLDSMGDMGYTVVTHGLVEVQKISNSGQTLDMNTDLEMCIKNIMIGLMVPSSLFDQDYGSYANASVGLEVLRDRYRNFQLQLKKWIEKKILEPIAKIQDFYTIENGEQKLIVPTVEWGKINLKETDTYLNAVSQALADPATPGSGKVSMRTWYELLDTDYETEQARLRMEARDSIVLHKEIEAMQHMDIAQLKTLSEETPIMDTRELDSLEKSLDIKDQGSEDSGDSAGGGIDFGGSGGSPGGMPDLGLPGGESEPPPDLGPPPGGSEPAGGAGSPPEPAGGAGTTPELPK